MRWLVLLAGCVLASEALAQADMHVGMDRFVGPSAAPAAGGSAPTNVTPPVVSPASPVVGIAESTTNGAWNNTPTSYSYQWYRADTSASIGGATSSSYTPVSGDIGHTLDAVVTASNTGGPASATSGPTGAVSASAPVITSASLFMQILGVPMVRLGATPLSLIGIPF